MISIKSIKEKENPLFDRKEIEAIVESKVAPSYRDIWKLFSEKYSVPIENLKINLIKGKFGFQEFVVKVNIYKNKEMKEIVEKKSKKEIEAEKLEEQEKKQTESSKSASEETQIQETEEKEKTSSEESPSEKTSTEKTDVQEVEKKTSDDKEQTNENKKS